MLYQIVITSLLILLGINLFLNLRALKRPIYNPKFKNNFPKVSVLVPARNEEKNIANCIKSLQNQNYPDYEIIVIDDNSTDNTYQILQEIAQKDTRLKILRGKPLPPDWAGKPHACQQLAEEARGEWLLFIDADTKCEPDMLRNIISFALEHKPALLSGFPRQVTTGLPQKVVIPLIYFIVITCTPLWWILNSDKPKPALAIGQFLLFSRKDYWKIGGHASVKARIMEDCWLSYEITRSGGRHITVDLTSVISCNMYQKIGDMWEGFIKWLYSIGTLSPAVLFLLLVIFYILMLAPFILLYHDIFIAQTPSDWQWLLIAQIIIIFVMRALVDHVFKAPPISAILHPLGFSYIIAVAITSLYLVLAGKGVKWKSRVYDQKSGIH